MDCDDEDENDHDVKTNILKSFEIMQHDNRITIFKKVYLKKILRHCKGVNHIKRE